jgi:hypothetical protein
MKWSVLLAVAATLAGLAAGCGGSNATTVTAAPIAISPFKKKVEQICARGRLRALRYEPRIPGQTERDALTERVHEVLFPALRGVVDEIEALRVPASVEDQIDALLGSLQGTIEAGEVLRTPTFDQVEKLLRAPGGLALRDRLASCVFSEP